jgi:hypothetical protein
MFLPEAAARFSNLSSRLLSPYSNPWRSIDGSVSIIGQVTVANS